MHVPVALPSASANRPLRPLTRTGQPAPFDHYPLIAGGVVVVALVYGGIVYARDRTLGERVGSVVADAD
jgi:hypothetical protein